MFGQGCLSVGRQATLMPWCLMITANRHPIVRGGYPRSAGADPSRRAGRAQVRSYSRAIDPTTRYAVTPRHRLGDAIRRRSGPGRDVGLAFGENVNLPS